MNLIIEQIIVMLLPVLILSSFIVIPVFSYYKANEIDPLNFGSIRNILAFINLVYLIFALTFGFLLCIGRGIEREFMLAGLIIFGAVQMFLINNDKLAEILYFHRINIKILLFKSFLIHTYNFSAELTKENGEVYFYLLTEDSPTAPVLLIREIDNIESVVFFTSLFWENYSKTANLRYYDAVNFAKNNGMVVRELNFRDFTEQKRTLFKASGININTASEQEIANLPLINIVTAKRVRKHIEKEGEFNSFWEFAKYTKLTPYQGLILSKLVFIGEINGKKQDKENEYDKELDI